MARRKIPDGVPDMTNSEIAEKLRGFGIHPSQQRIAVYACLDSMRNHPTAEMIYSALSPEHPSLSKTTVYNTLKLFHSRGAVRNVVIEDGEMRYDADTAPHAHFKCMKCGSISDLFFDPRKYLPELPGGFSAEEIHVNYRGLCSLCRQKHP